MVLSFLLARPECTARERRGSITQSDVGQPLPVRPVRIQIPVEDVVGDDRTFAIILRLSPPLRPRPHGVLPHQPFDPAQPAGKPFLEHVAPDATGAIGPVAGMPGLFLRVRPCRWKNRESAEVDATIPRPAKRARSSSRLWSRSSSSAAITAARRLMPPSTAASVRPLKSMESGLPIPPPRSPPQEQGIRPEPIRESPTAIQIGRATP